ncbi:hypothetical protein WJX74_000139 [Apatococcus lobatus]|uniref:RING-type domain-containing protein n=1 Tax=Apatococcus lobatus TaxID=904363 RepID=A0AAW1RPF0_9CHLO
MHMWWIVFGVFAGITILSFATFIAQCLAARRHERVPNMRVTWAGIDWANPAGLARQRSVAQGLSPELLAKLPVTQLDGEMVEGRREEDAECPVCQEVMEVGSSIARLPCEHTFHAACARQWLSRRPTCPTCRLLLDHQNLGSGPQSDIELGTQLPEINGWAEVPLQPIPAGMDKRPAEFHPHAHPSTLMPIVNPVTTSQRHLHAVV